MAPLVPGPVAAALDVLVTLFVFIVGLTVLTLIMLLVVNVSQDRDAIRRDYPVIVRFRYLFSTLNEIFPSPDATDKDPMAAERAAGSGEIPKPAEIAMPARA